MSYCRLGDDSDIYIYESRNHIVCCMCLFHNREGDEKFQKRSHMINHIEKHFRAGHKVPLYAIERIKEAMKSDGDITKVKYMN